MGIGLKPVEFEQPASFEFTAENFAKVKQIIARYPAGRERAALLPVLTVAQQQHDGWLPKAAINHVASILGVAPMKVYEVASFYSMYNLQPIGKYHIQVCGTTPCMLRGAEEVMHACESKLGIGKGETTPDGQFTLSEVECLGACVNAPMIQVTTPEKDGYYEDLTPHTVQQLIDVMAGDMMPDFGSMAGRTSSEPATGLTTLIGNKKTKPKLKAKITSIDDTGEPSEEALIRTGQKAGERADKSAEKLKKTNKKTTKKSDKA